MIARILRMLANRRRAQRLRLEEQMRADLESRLAVRRAQRAARTRRARAGAVTKVHQAFERDPLINSDVVF